LQVYFVEGVVMASGIPKPRLIKAIIDTFSEPKIRSVFKLMPTTNIAERLLDMRKDSLEEFLISSAKGSALFRDLKERFPNNMPRTFFLVKLPPRKYTEELIPLQIEKKATAHRMRHNLVA
jgi:hypothetical protein